MHLMFYVSRFVFFGLLEPLYLFVQFTPSPHALSGASQVLTFNFLKLTREGPLRLLIKCHSTLPYGHHRRPQSCIFLVHPRQKET